MTTLHIFKSPPDEATLLLVLALKENIDDVEYNLYESGVDYGELVSLIFEHDRVITWF